MHYYYDYLQQRTNTVSDISSEVNIYIFSPKLHSNFIKHMCKVSWFEIDDKNQARILSHQNVQKIAIKNAKTDPPVKVV